VAVNLSIKEVPEALAERLRARAERNHRSLQGELMAIIEKASFEGVELEKQKRLAATTQQGWMTVEDLVAQRLLKPLHFQPDLPLGVDIIRADRDSR
jgi:antitoxin FitA